MNVHVKILIVGLHLDVHVNMVLASDLKLGMDVDTDVDNMFD